MGDTCGELTATSSFSKTFRIESSRRWKLIVADAGRAEKSPLISTTPYLGVDRGIWGRDVSDSSRLLSADSTFFIMQSYLPFAALVFSDAVLRPQESLYKSLLALAYILYLHHQQRSQLRPIHPPICSRFLANSRSMATYNSGSRCLALWPWHLPS